MVLVASQKRGIYTTLFYSDLMFKVQYTMYIAGVVRVPRGHWRVGLGVPEGAIRMV